MRRRRKAKAKERPLLTIGQIARLKIGPGDVLVFKIDHCTDATRERIRQWMEGNFPGGKCLILTSGMELSVVAVQNKT